MIPIPLNDHARQPRAYPFQTTADRRLRARCQAILMADRGRRPHQIAEDLRVTPRPLQRWRNAYGPRGRNGLRRRGAPGRAPRLPETLAPEMIAWGTPGPVGCGLARATWTAAALATSLDQTKGLAVSARTMRACCPNHDVRPYRPTYQYRKGDPDQQEAARQDLETFKKSYRRCPWLVEAR